MSTSANTASQSNTCVSTTTANSTCFDTTKEIDYAEEGDAADQDGD